MNARSKISIADLSVEERLELIEVLWDSLGEPAELSEPQKLELDRRIETIDSGKVDATDWDEFRNELRARYF